jgi:hypothetical protein
MIANWTSVRILVRNTHRVNFLTSPPPRFAA